MSFVEIEGSFREQHLMKLGSRVASGSISILDSIIEDTGTGIVIHGDMVVEGSLIGDVDLGNPTALIGLNIVNGSALTGMRSDSAPALDQGIEPTWTGGVTDYGTGSKLSVGADRTKLSTLTVKQPVDVTDIGGTTTLNNSTIITGVGTTFLTSFGIGDRISLSSAPTTYTTVVSIGSDTSLTVGNGLGDGTLQTINKKSSIVRFDDVSDMPRLLVNDLGQWIGGMTFNVIPTVSANDGIFFDNVFQLGTKDANGRFQLWWHAPSSILRLGASVADGDNYSGGDRNGATEGIVAYGTNLASDAMGGSDVGYARIKPDRFGLYDIDSSLGTDHYYFRVDGTRLFFEDNNALKTFEVTRATGVTAHRITANTGTVEPAVTLTEAAHIALTASTERFDTNWNSARTVEWATGALATQRFHVFQAPTIAFVGGSTVTNAATVAITGAPVAGANATLTNTYALWVQDGASRFDGGVYIGAQELALANATTVDATASRALNTTYTNTSETKSIFVCVTVRCAVSVAGGNAYVDAKADTSTPPVTVVSGIVGIQSGLLGEDNTYQLFFVVPAGTTQNYRVDSFVTNGTAVLGRWYEVTM